VQELTHALSSGRASWPLRQAVQQVIMPGATSGADLYVGLIASARMFILTQRERVAA